MIWRNARIPRAGYFHLPDRKILYKERNSLCNFPYTGGIFVRKLHSFSKMHPERYVHFCSACNWSIPESSGSLPVMRGVKKIWGSKRSDHTDRAGDLHFYTISRSSSIGCPHREHLRAAGICPRKFSEMVVDALLPLQFAQWCRITGNLAFITILRFLTED
jgi:hypothetical protein